MANRRQLRIWPGQYVKRVQLGRMWHSSQQAPKDGVVSCNGDAAQSPQYWFTRGEHASARRIGGDGYQSA
jgi:hypothetical protein